MTSFAFRTTLFILFFLCLALLPRQEALAKAPCFRVQPGLSIDGLRLGMSLSEFQAHTKASKLPTRLEDPSYPYVYLSGPYRIVFKNAPNPVLSYLSLPLSKPADACLLLLERRIDLTGSWLSLASQIGSCGPVEHRTGGSVIHCSDQGLLLSKSREEGYTLSVQPAPSASQNLPRCSGYIQRGVLIATPQATLSASPSKATEFVLQQKQTYCMDRLVLRAETTPQDIPTMGECRTILRRGGTLVYCNHSGVTFFFAGPHARLERLEFYHQTHLPLSTTYPPPLP